MGIITPSGTVQINEVLSTACAHCFIIINSLESFSLLHTVTDIDVDE